MTQGEHVTKNTIFYKLQMPNSIQSARIESHDDAPLGFIRRNDQLIRGPLAVLQEFHRPVADKDVCDRSEQFGLFRYVQVGRATTNNNGILGWVKYITGAQTASLVLEQLCCRTQQHLDTTLNRQSDKGAVAIDGCVDVEATPLPHIPYQIHTTGKWALCCTAETRHALGYEKERELLEQHMVEYTTAANAEEQQREKEMKEKSERVIEESTEERSDYNVHMYTSKRVRAANARIKILQCDDAMNKLRNVIEHETHMMEQMHKIFPELPTIFLWQHLAKLDSSIELANPEILAKQVVGNWRRRRHGKPPAEFITPQHLRSQYAAGVAQYPSESRILIEENGGNEIPQSHLHVDQFGEVAFP